MRLLVVGAGSTGGYFGGRLAQVGRDVTFLVRPARAEQLRRDGLCIVSPHGDVTLRPKFVGAGALDGPYDAVLLTVKAYQLDAALDDLAPAIGPTTMILPVLNGMRHMDVISRRFGPERLIGCVLKVSTVLEEDGHIVQLSKLQDLAYGELDGTRSARVEALDAFMRGADIGARISNVILREMWEKWILLATLGAITCLMRGTIGEVEASAGGAAFAQQVLDEVVRIVTAVGVAPSQPFVNASREQLTAHGSPLTSSMYRDLQSGRPIEAESIVGDLVRRAAQAGVAASLLSAANVHLEVYQQRLARRGGTP